MATDSDTIDIQLSFSKDSLVCGVCYDPLTKQIFQCVNGSHYLCGECEQLWKKSECPTCRHPQKLVRNILFEQQLKQHLHPCPNVGCPEKFFKWQTDHKCKYAPVKCRVCKREVGGSVEVYRNHLCGGLCDEEFSLVNVEKFEKRLKYMPSKGNVVLNLPNKTLMIIRKVGSSYKIGVVRDPSIETEEYKNIVCTYMRDGIEYTVTIPVTAIEDIRTAEIHFNADEQMICIFSKDIVQQPATRTNGGYSGLPTHTGHANVLPTQHNLDELRYLNFLLNGNIPRDAPNVSDNSSDVFGTLFGMMR